MSSAKKPEAPRPARPASPADRSTVALPRSWFLILIALTLAPWLVVGSLYLTGGDTGGQPAPAASAGVASTARPGPWGTLAVTPIVVSPPLEYVSTDWGPIEKPLWYLPGLSIDRLPAFFTSAGLPADAVARLVSTARIDPRIGGTAVFPDEDLIRQLAPAVRARIYLRLAQSPYNPAQAHAFRFLGASSDAWLGGSLISSATRALVEPFIYHDDQFQYFADFDLLRRSISDEAELSRLAKALLRQSTVLVRLSVDDASQVDGLAQYWGRGGRRTDLRPLLESVADAGAAMDIVHLLPSFARDHLHRYPRLSAADYDKPIIANCLWTALNFFRTDPDDRFLDVGFALDTLKREYYVVQQNFELGDVVAFLDDEGDLYHVAVYLADDLVFSKNGTTPMAPWTIMTIDDLTGYYGSRMAEPRLIVHRRNDF